MEPRTLPLDHPRRPLTAWIIPPAIGMKVLVLATVAVNAQNIAGVGYFEEDPDTGAIRGTQIVAYCNGDPVYQVELEQVIRLQRAEVSALYHQEHGAESVPKLLVRKEAWKVLLKTKVQQQLMRDKGLWKDINYLTFLEEWRRFNQDRTHKIEAGEVVYGPLTYSKEQYFSYLFRNKLAELKKLLAKNKLKVEDAAVARYYLKMKDALFRKTPAITLQAIRLRKGWENSLEILEQVAQWLKGRRSLQEYCTNQPGVCQKIDTSNFVFQEETMEMDREEHPEIWQYAQTMSPGDISPVIKDRIQGPVVLQCTGVRGSAYVPFEEARLFIFHRLVDQKYDQLVAGLVKKARIVVSDHEPFNQSVQHQK